MPVERTPILQIGPGPVPGIPGPPGPIGPPSGLAPQDGYLYGMRSGTWVRVPQTRSVEFTYNNTVTAPPGGGQLRMNALAPSAVTLLWISETTAPGVDIKNFLNIVSTGIDFYIQDKDDSSKWVTFNVTGIAVDKGNYVEIPVVFQQVSANALSSGQRVMITNTIQF